MNKRFKMALPMRFLAAVCIGAFGSALMPRFGGSTTNQIAWCNQDTLFQNLTREKVERVVAANGPGDQEWRDHMNLPVVPASEIAVVHTASLCMKAGMMISTAFGRPASEQRDVLLIRVGGSRYWAEDHAFYYGGYPYRLVMDSTLTIILSKTM